MSGRRVLICLSLWLLLVPSMTVAQDREPLVMYVGFDSMEAKLAGQLFREVAMQYGYDVRYRLRPYRRSIAMANFKGDGELMRVGTISQIDPEITTNLVIVPHPIAYVTVRVWVSDRGLSINQLGDLKGLRNGVEYGVRYLEDGVPDILARSTIKELEFLLRRGRLDAIAFVSMVKPSLDGLYETYTERIEVHSFFHRRHAELAPLFSEEFRAQHLNGTYERLRAEVIKAYEYSP